MKILIIIALITLISYSQSIDEYTTFSCPDKKVKIGEDVCTVIEYVNDENDNTKYYTNYYIKKKSCGKNKECNSKGYKYNKVTKKTDELYTCQKKLRFLKIKKKCNYNAECYTGYCNNGKCATLDECTSNNEFVCGPGKYCKFSTASSNTGTCTAYSKEGVEVDINYEECAPGLFSYYDSDKSKSYCKKYFSLDKGVDVSSYGYDYHDYQKYCSTYQTYGGKCVEITEVDSSCSIKYDDGKTTIPVTADDSNTNNLYQIINGKRRCLYSTAKKELKDEVVKRYNKIKLDKLLEKENCDYEDYLCDKKYAELESVYENYENLLYYGLIKDNGDKNKDKKCEYEFWRSFVSSSYVNICFGFFFTLLGLLF